MHRIVVIGGGAGGLELVTRLGDRWGTQRRKPRAAITLVDMHPTHLWKPLLHEVAAGSIEVAVEQLEYAAQAQWHGFSFQQGTLKKIDRAKHLITLERQVNDLGVTSPLESTLEYDTLILAIGSVTHFLNVPGAEAYSFALDTANQAEHFRNRFMAAYLQAQENDTFKPLYITIIGAGATGIELAAELCHTSKALGAYRLQAQNPNREVRITVVELAPHILPSLPKGVSDATTKLLHSLSIETKVGVKVTEVKEHTVHLSSGEVIPSDLTVWAAGIKAPPILTALDGLDVNGQGQIIVKPTLESISDANIFALGDCASCPWLGQPEGVQVPPRAQAAHQQASFLLKVLKQRLNGEEVKKSFQYRDFGSLISIGQTTAVGNLRDGITKNGFIIRGWIARWIYASLYRMHIAALHGWVRMMLDAFGKWLSRFTRPRIKLH